MRAPSRAIGAGLVLGAFALTVTAAFAQADQTVPDDGSRESVECLLSRTPVQEAPFSAEATIVWQPPASSGRPERRASSRYYRDREGHVRVEQGFAGSGQTIRRIIIAAADGRAYDIDPVARTTDITLHGLAEMMVGSGCTDRFVLPLTGRRFVSFHQHPLAPESLGEQRVSGVHAAGTRFTTDLPQGVYADNHTERWVSSELKLVVYLRSEDSVMGTFEYHLTRISRAEPPPELFARPADCEVIPPENSWPRRCIGEKPSKVNADDGKHGWASPYTVLKLHW
jgi:hypothetical protein